MFLPPDAFSKVPKLHHPIFKDKIQISVSSLVNNVCMFLLVPDMAPESPLLLYLLKSPPSWSFSGLGRVLCLQTWEGSICTPLSLWLPPCPACTVSVWSITTLGGHTSFSGRILPQRRTPSLPYKLRSDGETISHFR